MKISQFVGGAASAMLMMASAVAENPAHISYPADYKTSFTNYLSLDRTQNGDQIIRLFANDVAMQGPAGDGKLPYGSKIVAEIYKAKVDDAGNPVVSSLGRRIRDKLVLLAVMERGEGFTEAYPAALKNDNWDFATFAPDGNAVEKDLNTCRGCHAPLTQTNHLFSFQHFVPQ